jgi:hypothetical protein
VTFGAGRVDNGVTMSLIAVIQGECIGVALETRLPSEFRRQEKLVPRGNWTGQFVANIASREKLTPIR